MIHYHYHIKLWKQKIRIFYNYVIHNYLYTLHFNDFLRVHVWYLWVYSRDACHRINFNWAEAIHSNPARCEVSLVDYYFPASFEHTHLWEGGGFYTVMLLSQKTYYLWIAWIPSLMCNFFSDVWGPYSAYSLILCFCRLTDDVFPIRLFFSWSAYIVQICTTKNVSQWK